MGTRGLIGFRLNNIDYVQYNHSDSYPTQLGKRMLEFGKSLDWNLARNRVAKIKLIDEDNIPTKAELKHVHSYVSEENESFEDMCQRFKAGEVKRKDHANWSTVLDSVTGSLDAWMEGLNYWPDYDSFQWSGSCEWAYIFNLDSNVLEIYTSHWRTAEDVDCTIYKVSKPFGRYAVKLKDGNPGILLVGEVSADSLKTVSDNAINLYCEALYKKY